jgi:cellulose biosynthesis protein BcsQ
VGTTSVTAALAWSLQLLGESVLVIDACADNLLRMSFNVDFTREEGWARALLDEKTGRMQVCAIPPFLTCCRLVN